MTTGRLSAQQRRLLIWLLDQTETCEKDSDRAAALVATWGVYYRTGAATHAESASWSRTLRRLEARGLVVRNNDWSMSARHDSDTPAPSRAHHVRLTEAGRVVAVQLRSG